MALSDLLSVYGPASLSEGDVAWVLDLLRTRARRMTGPAREAEVRDGLALKKAIDERLPDRPTVVAAVRVLDRFMTRVRSVMEFVGGPACSRSCPEDLFHVVNGAVLCALCDAPTTIASAA